MFSFCFFDFFRKFLSLWQLTNGISFIQIIYSRDDDVIDCEYLSDSDTSHQFIEKFYQEIHEMDKINNFGFYGPKFRHNFENSMSKFILDANSDDKLFDVRNITYQRLFSETDIPNDLLPMLSFTELKQQCDERHRHMMRVANDMSSENELVRENATQHLNR